MEKIRVLLVDDHPVLLDGLATLLEVKCPDIEVVGLAQDGAAALELCGCREVDIVLLDIRMPGMNGVDTTIELRRLYPAVKVIALTTFDDEEYIWGALNAGASGYILKNQPWQEIVRAVHTVFEGGVLLDPGVVAKVVRKLNKSKEPPAEPAPESGELTARDRDLLRLLAQGKDAREIAAILFLNDHTVRNYLCRLYERIEVRDRTDAAVWAIEHGYAAKRQK